jgi:hypothetical protein
MTRTGVVKNLGVAIDHNLKHKFRTEQIEIFENLEARARILEHPKCPFREFAFWGECEIDMKWYYVAGNGPVYESTTQIILLEK